MTVREALIGGASVLSGTGSDTSHLDASLLLARAAGCTREALLARYPDALSPEVSEAFRVLLARRASGESVAYILGRKEFYGRVFRVDDRVLVPRPDTEVLVEAALEAVRRMAERRNGAETGGTGPAPAPATPGRKSADASGDPYQGFRIHDAFTGSGCVGVTLAAELPGAEVSLSDRSSGARGLAAWNSRELLGRELPVLESDVLSAVPGIYDLITANPPYVTTSETDRLLGGAPGAGEADRGAGPGGGLRSGWPGGADGIRREPRAALDGGADGLGFYRKLVPEAEKRLASGGFLAVEIGEEQGAAVSACFREHGFLEVEVLPDLAGRDRAVRGMRA